MYSLSSCASTFQRLGMGGDGGGEECLRGGPVVGPLFLSLIQVQQH